MNKERILYRPYYSYIFLAPIITICAIPLFVISFLLIAKAMTISTLFIFCLAMATFYVNYHLYLLSSIEIFIEDDGIKVIRKLFPRVQYFPWTALTHGYYVSNCKCQWYLILAADSISNTELKKIANNVWDVTTPKRPDIIIIFINRRCDIEPLKTFVIQKVPSVCDVL